MVHVLSLYLSGFGVKFEMGFSNPRSPAMEFRGSGVLTSRDWGSNHVKPCEIRNGFLKSKVAGNGVQGIGFLDFKGLGEKMLGNLFVRCLGEKSTRFWLMSMGISVNLEIYLLKTKPKQKSAINEQNS
jgi:hypothetical protein